MEILRRFVLVLYLVVAHGGAFVLEQAGSSVAIEHDRARVFRSAVNVENVGELCMTRHLHKFGKSLHE